MCPPSLRMVSKASRLRGFISILGRGRFDNLTRRYRRFPMRVPKDRFEYNRPFEAIADPHPFTFRDFEISSICLDP